MWGALAMLADLRDMLRKVHPALLVYMLAECSNLRHHSVVVAQIGVQHSDTQPQSATWLVQELLHRCHKTKMARQRLVAYERSTCIGDSRDRHEAVVAWELYNSSCRRVGDPQ